MPCSPDTEEAQEAQRRYREEQEREASPLPIPEPAELPAESPDRELVPA